MAVVFRGRRTDGKHAVAIKVMRPEIGYEDGVVERFHIEGEVMAQLDHPHIVRINARGEDGEILWLEMDLVEGSSLAAVLKRGPVAWRRAARLIAEAADALAYAHARGVVHRDVKPANLLLTNAEDRLVVADFGIARIVDSRRLTATGVVVGTPSYMSPEQLAAKGEFVPASDQYALGAVAYEMITGTFPESGLKVGREGSVSRFLRRKRLRSLGPACPHALGVLVARMLELRPENRWPDLGVVSRLAREIAETGTATSLQRRTPGRRIVAMFRRMIEANRPW